MANLKKPPWLKVKMHASDQGRKVENILNADDLHTVCQSAACPNQSECFNRKTATFLLMGTVCTRNCRFCNIVIGKPLPLDVAEPQKVAGACIKLGLKHCVITSVTRDDLTDGGAGHFAATIRAIKKAAPGIVVEVLIPDFQGRTGDLEKVLDAGPHILNHNVETIRRLYPLVRPQAQYDRSLQLLRRVKQLNPGVYSKSGFMLGLGETDHEMDVLLEDLRATGCDLLTIGQYLAPTRAHFPVKAYIHPDKFNQVEAAALKIGFLSVSAGPLVRSSYNAAGFYQSVYTPRGKKMA
jgi:lipoic acid synthetase